MALRSPRLALLIAMSLLTIVADADAADQPKQPEDAGPAPRLSAATAYAVPLEGITIDGSLDDWPEDLPRYAPVNQYAVYGSTDIDEADLTRSDDLSATFMVGYDVFDDLIYLAVVVRDDRHVVGDYYDVTDAIEVLVQTDEPIDLYQMLNEPMIAMQYHAVPGDGSYARVGNPGLLQGEIEKTRTRMSSSREGDTTIYEMAIEPFERYPDLPRRLDDGLRFGFDVVVIDHDGPEQPSAMVSWGPNGSHKFCDAAVLGELVIVQDRDELGAAAGRVTRAGDGEPFGGLTLEAYQGEVPAGEVRADADGRYRLVLPAGTYRIGPARWQGAQRGEPVEVRVEAGNAAAADLSIAPLAVPAPLAAACERYAKLRSYRETTDLQVSVTDAEGQEQRQSVPIDFAFERPSRLRFASDSPIFAGLSVVSDGQRIGTRIGGSWIAEPAAVGEVIGAHQMRRGLANDSGASLRVLIPAELGGRPMQLPVGTVGLVGGLFVHRLVMSPDPLAEALRGADRIEEVGEAVIDGRRLSVVEIDKPVPLVFPNLRLWGTRYPHEPVTLRLWIGEDGLIRRCAFDFDLHKLLSQAPREGETPRVVTFTTDHPSAEVDQPIEAEVFELPRE